MMIAAMSFFTYQLGERVLCDILNPALTGSEPYAIDWGEGRGADIKGGNQIIVARRARRRRKAFIKTQLIHAKHYRIKVTCQVKARLKVKNTVHTFWTPDRLDGLYRAQTHQKCSYMYRKAAA